MIRLNPVVRASDCVVAAGMASAHGAHSAPVARVDACSAAARRLLSIHVRRETQHLNGSVGRTADGPFRGHFQRNTTDSSLAWVLNARGVSRGEKRRTKYQEVLTRTTSGRPVAGIVMLQRMRRCFARVVLSLMVCHAAALAASSLCESAFVPTAVAQGCRCCCSGHSRMPTCPMERGQGGRSCRLRCGPKSQSMLVIGVPGVPIPTFEIVGRPASESVSAAQPAYADIILPVRDQPPRQTTCPR